MKKAIIILSSIFLVGIGFYGCKKGAKDPFLSFRSRDKRLMGEWTVSTIDLSVVTNTKGNTVNQTFYSNTVETETTSFNGSTWSYSDKTDYSGNPTPATTSETQTDNYSKIIKLTIDKHGVAKSTETSTYTSTTLSTTPANTCGFGGIPGVTCDGTYTETTTTTTTKTYEGTWIWANDKKDKESIYINLPGGIMNGFYMIEELKNKEIILKQNSTDGSANSGASNSSLTITETGTYTLTGDGKAVK